MGTGSTVSEPVTDPAFIALAAVAGAGFVLYLTAMPETARLSGATAPPLA